jgi:hypothetical protein
MLALVDVNRPHFWFLPPPSFVFSCSALSALFVGVWNCAAGISSIGKRKPATVCIIRFGGVNIY